MIDKTMNQLFVLNGSTGNRGCEAILISTFEILSQAFPHAQFINSSTKDPRAFKVRHLQHPNLAHDCHPDVGKPAWFGWQIAKRFKGSKFYFEHLLPWADVVFSLGGDNYSMDYGSARTYFEGNERILEAGKKLIIWGASVGPFTEDPALERIAANQLKRVHKIVVRESRSQAYLKKLGISSNVVLMPDPAFSLKTEPFRLPSQVEDALSQGAIGVNLSPLLARYRDQPHQWVADSAAWIKSLLQTISHPIILLPHVMQQGNDDAAFMEGILKTIQVDSKRLMLLQASNLSSTQLKYVISRTKCFIGARTHATIAAMSSNVPTISIGYSVKALGINEDVFGSDEWVLDHKNLTGAALADKTLSVLKREQAIRNQLATLNQSYRMDPAAVMELLN